MKMHGVALMRLLSLAMAVLASAAAVATENGPNRRPSAAPGAHPEACYTIANPDMRNLCRARAASDTSACYAIMAADLRAYCRATVGGR
jgi:hypothetical protein